MKPNKMSPSKTFNKFLAQQKKHPQQTPRKNLQVQPANLSPSRHPTQPQPPPGQTGNFTEARASLGGGGWMFFWVVWNNIGPKWCVYLI